MVNGTRSLRFACVALTIALLVLCAACGGENSADEDVGSPVRGMLLEVRISASGDADAITLRDDGGRMLTFEVQLAEDAFVTTQHLQEHIDLEWPVLVAFTGTGDGRVAHWIDDAP